MRAVFPSSLAGGLLAAGLLGGAAVAAQVGQGAPPPAVVPQPARVAAPIDITGTWAQVVTEDWQWRFITPAKGDYTAVPLTAEASKIAMAWDPAADVAAGNQCKPFGAAAIMRLPTRMQISWVDDNTLKLEWDLGTQSRVADFDKTRPAGARSWQGHAVAEWIDVGAAGRGGGRGGAPGAGPGGPAAAAAADGPGRGADGGRGAGAGTPGPAPAGRGPAPAGRGAAGRGAAPAPRPGGLKMVTTNLRAQYLRMNGVPISENATVTDVLDLVPGPNGDQWLIVRTTVEDPQFLSQPYITSQQFKKEPNASKWNPTPCELLPRAKGTATQVPGRGGE